MAENRTRRAPTGADGGGAVYGLGLIGALVYYIGAADGFWQGALGVLKAFVWPAFVVHDLLRLLGS
ncbi:hypothetical protein BJY16_006202 [Actinoplanes octamycinicus]|uniref:Uncharacterized protein n=1 Tax=Actinoplanes octamycinicus TaxID=135948 RepID=A0A7W7MA62_9ACTN|nr:hypothetical protein [Actinoplanes octamycinicus]MBB4742743.1 hypothetical protein [Actinoplanes octamycinicus]GIE63043.1 hypothetical protein Aoc01nite_84450 [Actinoplanes octamycinicus]